MLNPFGHPLSKYLQKFRIYNTVNLDYLQYKGTFDISHVCTGISTGKKKIQKKQTFFSVEYKMNILPCHASTEVTFVQLQYIIKVN